MGLTRRQALAGIGGALAAGAAVELAKGAAPRVPVFAGGRQPGILAARQDHLTLAAFDLHTPDRADLRRLLADWTALIVGLCEARGAVGDTGEAEGLGSRGLTITVGFGASLFDDRYGLRDRRPAALRPARPGDERLEAGGDLLVQVCADDRQVAFHAVHQLANAALGIARPRWTQHGFVSRPQPGATPRNLFGFADGAANLEAGDPAGLARHVWVPDGPLAGGTYLAYRRVRLRMQAWDRAALEEQEQSIGRRKASGARFASGSRAHARSVQPCESTTMLATRQKSRQPPSNERT